MRKLIVLSMITLDGVIQGPGGPEEDTSGGFEYGGWVAPYSDDVVNKAIREQMSERFDLLLGRKTYDIWAAYWPHHDDIWPGINEVKKYVASHDSSLKLDWKNSVLLKGNVADEVRNLKTESGPALHVYGSADLIQTLLKNDLVDEFWFKIYPVTLGPGKRLFAEGTIPAAFELTDSRVSPKGVIVANYKRAGDVKTWSVA